MFKTTSNKVWGCPVINTAFLYLLVYPDLNAFKIGKANDVVRRAEMIQRWWGMPDYGFSYYAEVPRSIVFEVEKALHCMLGSYSLSFSEGDGKTEFFRLDSLGHALNLLEYYQTVNGCNFNVMQGVSERVHCRPKRQQVSMAYKRHNAGCRRFEVGMTENAGRLKRILRINNLLLRYPHRFDFSIDRIDDNNYKLTFCSHLSLARIVSENLCVKGGSLSVASGSSCHLLMRERRSSERVVIQLKFPDMRELLDDGNYPGLIFCSELRASFGYLEGIQFNGVSSLRT
ncbi:GIY-YIG nuclease family protein [Vibrio sp. PNB22_3_1]